MATETIVDSPSIEATESHDVHQERPSRTHVDSSPLPTDSMVSVSLSSEASAEEVAEEEENPAPTTPTRRDTIISEQNTPSANAAKRSSNEEEAEDQEADKQETNQQKANEEPAIKQQGDEEDKDEQEAVSRETVEQKPIEQKPVEQEADEQEVNEQEIDDQEVHVTQEHAGSGNDTVKDAEPVDENSEDSVEEAIQDEIKADNEDQARGDVEEHVQETAEGSQESATDQLAHETAVEVVDEETAQRARSASTGSGSSTKVDWPELERTEQAEPKDEASDESTAFLLAQLEQANAALATDPKSGLKTNRPRTQSRPPSIYQLRKMVEDPTSPNPRLSVMPSPPPMTELEFWTALVQDYPQTAQRLPTLTSNKIRAGVPPPLRGVVWVSMAGARDIELENKFDSLCNETSPYEGAISKDIGRSFPGVEMFRDADGEGQRMLSRVLTSFSLYDPQIGYCQGLGFLVGPLLMQMGEREAFCVLVRLMERYDLRCCFLPDLSGLHLRIYQFQQMLAKHLPQLAAHLDSMQVEAAYLSQWFLSLFAVTCPLPMLFRIYDVILAEGAPETLMRVAMSLMRRNEKRILASTEFEEVMQLLLSRSLWEPYGQNADELVNDFVSFTGMVTHEGLQTLENKFKAFQSGTTNTEGLSPNAQATASSFLGRLWLGSPSVRNTGSLSPKTPGTTSGSFLRRSPSKQSMASTLNSVEGTSSSNPSSASTNSSTMLSDNTDITRNSSADAMSLKSGIDASNARATMSSKDRDLHGQIEDLLTALSEMQRDHAVLAMQLQQEREERDEDHRIVRTLLDRLKAEKHHAVNQENKRRTSPWFLSRPTTLAPPPRGHGRSVSVQAPKSAGSQSASFASAEIELPNEVVELVETVDLRFSAEVGERKPSTQTKQQLRESLTRAKEQLRIESSHFQDLSRQVDEQDKEGEYVRHKLEEVCGELKQSQEERQLLEQELEDLRAEKTPIPCSCNTSTPKASRHKRANSNSSASSSSSSNSSRNSSNNSSIASNALKPFKLWHPPSQSMPSLQTQGLSDLQRNDSSEVPAQGFPKRSSSLAAPPVLDTTATTVKSDNNSESELSSSERDALLQELVSAKTGEAVARQELEELKAKMEALRRVLGPVSANSSAGNSPDHATPSSSHGIGVLGHRSQLSTVSRAETVPATKGEREENDEKERDEKNHAKEKEIGKEKAKGKELVPHPAASSGGGGGGGFWSWGKRSFSSSNISAPSK
ncbi:MAG: hypothetical protein M1821_010069 [Bathelium mastoideum]|nr:MAG: hypothetical protein M1821_010069 [Bathelium mastoideum]